MDLIEDLRVEDGTLWVRPVSEFGARFLADDFWAVYDGEIDLRRVDEAVALMPFVLNTVPVAWASGDTWSVPALDRRQAELLPKARATLRRWFPGCAWDGELTAERLEESGPTTDDGPPVILFSGGVDSTYSALSVGRPAVLLLIRGNDIALDNAPGWARVVRDARATAARLGHRLVTVETSFRRFLRRDVLDALDPGLENWWAHAQHGLAIAGLAAPVAAQVGSRRILVPATHTRGFVPAWGSDPDLEENAAFGGVAVEHHGYELTRHGRLRGIMERVDELGPLPLRVCYSRVGGDGGNCLACQKCLRTSTSILVESREPLAFGFPLAPAEIERRVRAGFEAGQLEATGPSGFQWKDLKGRAQETRGMLSPDFHEWLLALELHVDWEPGAA